MSTICIILHRNIRNRRKRRPCFVFSYDFSVWSGAQRNEKTKNCSAALRDLLRICETVRYGTNAAQGTMQPFSVIEKLYETVQIRLHHLYCSIFSLKCQSIFEGCKKTFLTGNVIRTSGCAQGFLYAGTKIALKRKKSGDFERISPAPICLGRLGLFSDSKVFRNFVDAFPRRDSLGASFLNL